MEPATRKKKSPDLKDSLEWLLSQSPWAKSVNEIVEGEGDKRKVLDIKESLEWLLGRSGHSDDSGLSESERAARYERRLELLVWLLNLETRLPPYGDEQPA